MTLFICRFGCLLLPLVLLTPVFGQEESSASNPDAIRLYNSAVEFQNQGLYGLAADEWQDLLKRFEKDPLVSSAHYFLGTCRFQEGKFAEAAKSFAVVVKDHPKFDRRSAALTNLGLAEFNAAQAADGKQRYKAAIKAFEQQLSEFADSPLAPQSRFYLGESQYAVGEKEKALATYRDWLAKHADNQLAADVQLAFATTAVELDKPKEAIDPLKQLIAAKPAEATIGEARLQLGEAYLAMGKLKEARDSFDAASKIDFLDTDYALQQSGTAAYEMGDLAAAGQRFAQVAERFPESSLAAQSLLLAGRCATEVGDVKLAVTLLDKAAAAGVKGGELAHWQVRAALGGGDAAAAVAKCDAALTGELSPAERQVLLLDKADALYAIEDRRAESVAVYQSAADGEGNAKVAAKALHLAAATALEVGQLGKAQQSAEKYTTTYTDGVDLADTMQILAESQLQQADAKAAAETYKKLLDSTRGGDERRNDWTIRYAWCLFTDAQHAKVVEVLKPVAADGEAAYLVGRSAFAQKDFAAAIAALKTAAASDTRFSEEASLLAAQAQLAADDSAGARATVDEALKKFANGKLTARLLFHQGEALANLAEVDAAVAAYRKVCDGHAKSPLAPYANLRAGQLAAKQGNNELAAEILNGFAAKYPDHPLLGNATLARATALQRLGKHEDALTLLTSDAGTKVDANRLSYAKAVSLAANGKPGEAATILEGLRKDAPDFSPDRVLYELGFAYKNSEQPDKALATFGDLVKAAPDSPLAAEAEYRIGELLYAAEKYEEAATHYVAACGDLADDQLKLQSHHLAGWAYSKAGKHDQATKQWEAQLAVRGDGELARDAKWLVADAKFKAEDYEAALLAFQSAGEELPTAPGLAPLVLLHAGQAAGQAEKWDTSMQWLDRVLNEYPEYAGINQAKFEKGVALQNLGKIDEARDLFAGVAGSDTSPLGYRARFMEGEMLFAKKDYQDAVKSFFRIFAGSANADLGEEYQEWQAEAMFEAARCLEQLDRSEAARKLYAELIERFPKQPKAELARKQLGG